MGAHHSNPEKAQLGGNGGNFEAIACDDRNSSQPIFFVTEDHVSEALRNYTPQPMIPGTVANWDTLYAEEGNTEYLVFIDNNTFIWSCDERLGRHLKEKHFPNVEAVDACCTLYPRGRSSFMCSIWTMVHT